MILSPQDLSKFDSPERRSIQDVGRFLDLARTFSWKVCADLGCGTGYFSLPLAEEWKDSRVVLAIDRSTIALEEIERRVAERGLANIRVLQAVSDRVPLDDGVVDLVNMGNLYHELKGRLNYLKEVYRVLKPGGVLLLTDWEAEEEMVFGPPLLERIPAEQVKKDLEYAGFERIRRHFPFAVHYVFSARRPRSR